MDKTTINVTLKKGIPYDTVNIPEIPSISECNLIFRGDKGNPFLAPRGVHLANGKLIVSDTGQNRVFIWNELPESEYQRPDIVLGQSEIANTGRNGGTEVSASTLMYPSGVWSDGKALIIADAWNHRVLIWHQFPCIDGQPADTVIGQPDFKSNLPNVSGIGHAPSAQTLNWPYGITVHEGRLFIADTGNRRVLVYNTIPKNNFTAADHVIGKRDFTERDYDSEDAIWPYSVKINPSGALAITDTQYYRVLLWSDWKKTFHDKSAIIIGQKSIEQNGQNQFELFPMANTLSWCYDTLFYKSGIFVADTGNSRVLWFNTVPEYANPSADSLIGKKDFHTGSENAETAYGTENAMYWPFSISADPDADILAIADTGNHRILLHKIKVLND